MRKKLKFLLIKILYISLEEFIFRIFKYSLYIFFVFVYYEYS